MRAIVCAAMMLATGTYALAPTASATGHTEADILSAYLATGDVGSPAHCSRDSSNNVHLDQHFLWHSTTFPSTSFLVFHHQLVHTYEAWRSANGHPALVSWDPSTPMPASFAVHAGCPARSTSNPGIATPTWATVAGGATPAPIHGHHRLCEFRDEVQLGQSLVGWHDGTHVAVSGDMSSTMLAPRDPIFWAWHRYVDDIYHTWQKACGKEGVLTGGWTNGDPGCYQAYQLYEPAHLLHTEHAYVGEQPSGPYYRACYDATYPYQPCRGTYCPPAPCPTYDRCPYRPYVDLAEDAYRAGYGPVYGYGGLVEETGRDATGRGTYTVVEPWLRGAEPAPPRPPPEPRDWCKSETAVDAAGHYVILDADAESGEVGGFWIYQESNGIDGLQRGDENCKGDPDVKPDTVIL